MYSYLSCADAEGIICVQLLTELLCNKATKRLKKVLYHFQVCQCHVQDKGILNYVTFVHFQGGEDLDEEIAKIPMNALYIVVMEANEATTYDVIVERLSLFQLTDFMHSIN